MMLAVHRVETRAWQLMRRRLEEFARHHQVNEQAKKQRVERAGGPDSHHNSQRHTRTRTLGNPWLRSHRMQNVKKSASEPFTSAYGEDPRQMHVREIDDLNEEDAHLWTTRDVQDYLVFKLNLQAYRKSFEAR